MSEIEKILGVITIFIGIASVVVAWFSVQSNKKMVKYMANTDNRENENHIVGDVSRIRAVENKLTECAMSRTKETNEKFSEIDTEIEVMKTKADAQKDAFNLALVNLDNKIDEKFRNLEKNINLQQKGVNDKLQNLISVINKMKDGK
jgi:hypothetical protein